MFTWPDSMAGPAVRRIGPLPDLIEIGFASTESTSG